MTAPVFVDTNVFVYALHSRESLKQPMAREWLDRVWRERLGRTSIQVLSECYVTLTRKLKPSLAGADAWDYVRSLLPWRPQPIDAELLSRGREIEERYSLNWWDSLIVSAAQLQECSVLLTEDLQDGTVFGGVVVRNPFALRASDELKAHKPGGFEPPAYPRRGRPKRAARLLERQLRPRV